MARGDRSEHPPGPALRRLRRAQRDLLSAGGDRQRALHPRRRAHDDRSRTSPCRRGWCPGRRASPTRSSASATAVSSVAAAGSSAISRSRSRTRCGRGTTSTSPTRTTATRNSTVPISRQAMPERPVRVGAGSWLGHGTVVLPGATIGRHVVIGANSVVRGEIPPYTVAAGNPASVVKRDRAVLEPQLDRLRTSMLAATVDDSPKPPVAKAKRQLARSRGGRSWASRCRRRTARASR